MSTVALLRSPIAATVREVGTFPGHASPLVVLDIGEATIRIPVTPDEARAFGARLNDVVTLRLAVEAPRPTPSSAAADAKGDGHG